jgi:hypothetical protein
MASGPVSFLQAVKKVKEVEQAYELGDNRPPLEGLTGRVEDQVVRTVRQDMSHLRTSTREKEMWENRRPENRPKPRAPPRDSTRAHEGPRAHSPECNCILNHHPGLIFDIRTSTLSLQIDRLTNSNRDHGAHVSKHQKTHIETSLTRCRLHCLTLCLRQSP